MRVISTNVSEPKVVEWRGKNVSTGIFKEPVDKPIHLGFEDVIGDSVIDRRFHGGTDKACYLYSYDHYPMWQEKYPNLDFTYGMFGENLTVEGLHESDVFIGDTYRLGTAQIQFTQPRQPCYKLGIKFETQKVVKEFVMASLPGVYIKVLKEGIVSTGDVLIPEEIKRCDFSLKEIFQMLYLPQTKVARVREAIDQPFLAESAKMDLIKKYKL